MKVIKQPAVLRGFVQELAASGRITGFVPTMGALHAGHLDLVNRSVSACDATICSIFVNPTQFNDPADYQKYPQTIENDIRLLEQTGLDILFLPDAADVYPSGLAGLETYPLGHLEEVLEGQYRPGHFQGVCQVVHRLLQLTNPNRLFMGQKDFQQCMVIDRLLRLTAPGTELVRCATVRESDGLAMSSRNLRLSPAQRAVAPALFQTLSRAAARLGRESAGRVCGAARTELEAQGFRPDYVAVATQATLDLAPPAGQNVPLVILAAAFLGDVRLIDNLLVD